MKKSVNELTKLATSDGALHIMARTCRERWSLPVRNSRSSVGFERRRDRWRKNATRLFKLEASEYATNSDFEWFKRLRGRYVHNFAF